MNYFNLSTHVLLIGNFFDMIMTLVGTHIAGIQHEANPAMKYLLEIHPLAFITLKFLWVTGLIYLVHRLIAKSNEKACKELERVYTPIFFIGGIYLAIGGLSWIL